MNRDDIMRIAQDCWVLDKHDCSDDWFVRADAGVEEVVKFGKLVIAAEREACAKAVEGYCGAWDDQGYALTQIIRTRGEK